MYNQARKKVHETFGTINIINIETDAINRIRQKAI